MIRVFLEKKFDRKIDEKISTIELLSFCVDKFICLLRGIIVLHKFVFLSSKCKISKKRISYGDNCRIATNVTLDSLSENGISLGNNCSIGKNTRIECTGSLTCLGKGFKCGDNCGLGTDSFYGCAGGIEIGNDVIVGNFVSMHSENHNYTNLEMPIRLQGVNHKGITIGNNCWIGAKVTILDGTVIGDGCVVAAGAVVTGVYPNNVVIGGIPAKILKERI